MIHYYAILPAFYSKSLAKISTFLLLYFPDRFFRWPNLSAKTSEISYYSIFLLKAPVVLSFCALRLLIAYIKIFKLQYPLHFRFFIFVPPRICISYSTTFIKSLMMFAIKLCFSFKITYINNFISKNFFDSNF